MSPSCLVAALTGRTPPQPFKVQLDTGSPSLWVFGEHCYTCTTQRQYDKSSTTFSDPDDWDILTLGGGKVPMQYARDVVSVGGHSTSEGFEFGVAGAFEDARGNSIMASGIDGIMGLSRPFAGRPPPVWADTGVKEFGLHIRREGETFKARHEGALTSFDGGELMLGCVFPHCPRFARSHTDIRGINETLVEGDALPLELRDVEGFWAATLDGLHVSGRAVKLSTDVAILDSGDSYITLRPDDYAALMGAIGAQRLGHEWDRTGFAGMHYVPCSEVGALEVAFVFARREFALHPYDLVTPIEGVCVLSNVNAAPHVRGVLLGVPFLMNVYSVFGLDPPSLALYRLKDEYNPDWRLRIAADGSVVAPAPALVLGLGGEFLPTQLGIVLALLTLAVLGALLLSALHALPRPRHRKHLEGYKYTLLQHVPAMGW